jgi:hypothetical protein
MPITKKSLATHPRKWGVARLDINRLFYVTIFKSLIIIVLRNYFIQK